MVTIKDIAAKANVSLTTASLVLNGKEGAARISDKTKSHVLEVAAALGYVPNLSARLLRQQGGNPLSMALLLPHDSRVSIMGDIITGIQRFLASGEAPVKCSLTVEMYNAGELSDVPGLKESVRYNGAILANLSGEDEQYMQRIPSKIPCVLLQRKSAAYDSVDADNITAGREVARHYVANGHRKIVVLVPELSSNALSRRVNGIMEELSMVKTHEVEPVIRFCAFSEEGGYLAVNDLLAEGMTPTAIVSLSDQIAMGALSALNRHGIAVPDECELIGFDNLSMSPYTVPPLSTVSIPVQEMAFEASRLLLASIMNPNRAPSQMTFPMPLIHRSTTIVR